MSLSILLPSTTCFCTIELEISKTTNQLSPPEFLPFSYPKQPELT